MFRVGAHIHRTGVGSALTLGLVGLIAASAVFVELRDLGEPRDAVEQVDETEHVDVVELIQEPVPSPSLAPAPEPGQVEDLRSATSPERARPRPQPERPREMPAPPSSAGIGSDHRPIFHEPIRLQNLVAPGGPTADPVMDHSAMILRGSVSPRAAVERELFMGTLGWTGDLDLVEPIQAELERSLPALGQEPGKEGSGAEPEPGQGDDNYRTFVIERDRVPTPAPLPPAPIFDIDGGFVTTVVDFARGSELAAHIHNRRAQRRQARLERRARRRAERHRWDVGGYKREALERDAAGD